MWLYDVFGLDIIIRFVDVWEQLVMENLLWFPVLFFENCDEVQQKFIYTVDQMFMAECVWKWLGTWKFLKLGFNIF